MQTSSEAAATQPTIVGTLAVKLRHALQVSPEPTEDELFEVIRTAYSLSEQLYSALTASGEIKLESPAHPARDPDSDIISEEELDTGNVAFYVTGDGSESYQDMFRALKKNDGSEVKGWISTAARDPIVATASAAGRSVEQQESDDESALEGHSAYDIPALTSSLTDTIDKFITSCFEDAPIPSDLSGASASSRLVREVERFIRKHDRVT
ncbi:hypothetical protein BDZ89DRAFT_237944 [Hymenopellis radicata]|nr:hypothetical protein BDZ89DRAFT_237944 [Hymenopellis radicata]